ncbi:FIG00591428: hypothetical protein [hydrothermal vent metagenome]|uniref:AmpG permease n=1 Tax=hydrothermal vent metagenome TaxID=652676 RepID=A0A3B0UYF6_9ZZZZ
MWAFSTYFAEGFPYTIIRTISALFFRDQGMSLQGLGAASIFGLPWVLKFLWGPLVDNIATKRLWLLTTEGLITLAFLIAAILAPLTQAVNMIAALFFAASFIAATHDIAIDGFYMEALDLDAQARYLGYRVMAYRIAMMTGSGVIATIGALYGWRAAFMGADILMFLLLIVNLTILPHCEAARRPEDFPGAYHGLKALSRWILPAAGVILLLRMLLTSAFIERRIHLTIPFFSHLSIPGLINIALFSALIFVWFGRKRLRQLITANPDNFYARSFLTFVDRPRIGVILAFIISIRAGEYMLSTMYIPFMVDLGLKLQYGWISAGIGLPASIVGAMCGGWAIGRYGLRKMIWPFLLLQNITNLVYMALAFYLSGMLALNTANPAPLPLSLIQMTAVVVTHAFDQFAGGLGTAVLMTYLMRICRTDFKASHYAIGTGLMGLSGLYAGTVSGFITAWVGYGAFFGISFLASVPGMVLVCFVPMEEKVSAP